MDTNLSRRICTINHNLRCHYGEINKLHAKETFNNIKINGDKGTTLSNGKLTGLGLPVNNSDAVNKEYVLNVIQGLDLKESVLVASTSNIDLQNLPDPLQIDGVQIKNGDRVLLKDQTSQSENGIYLYKNDQLIQQAKEESNIEQKNQDIIIKTSTNSKLEYAEDWADKLVSNAFVFVEHGDTNNSTGFVVVGGGTEKKAGEHDIIFTIFSENTNIKGSKNITISKGEIISLNDNIELKGTIKANIVETNNIKSLTYLNIESDKASLELKSNNIKIKGNLISYSDDNIGSSNNYFNNIYVNNFNTKSIDHSNGHLIPKLDNTYDVGSSSYKFKTAHINNVMGNAATVTNGVYTTGNQTIDGIKTFTDILRVTDKIQFSDSATNEQDSFEMGVFYDSMFIGTIPSNPSYITGANYSLGRHALANITGGDYNIGIGYYALNKTEGTESYHGDYNIAIGTCALKNNINGYGNIAIGSFALENNTESENIAIGNFALKENTTGKKNTTIGTHSLAYNTSGESNVAVGLFALHENTTGEKNTAIGTKSLRKNNGKYNVALGAGALQDNITGEENIAIGVDALNTHSSNHHGIVAIGFEALKKSTNANMCTAIGWRALTNQDLTGEARNVAVGNSALESNTYGTENTAIGCSAGHNITTGLRQISIGYGAKPSGPSTHNEIVIGSDAVGHGDNIVVLGMSDTVAWHPPTDNNVDLGSSSYNFKTAYISNITGSAATLTTARNIGGVSFDGSANIDLPGVNSVGNQNTTGSAATLTTARTIGGVFLMVVLILIYRVLTQ